MSSIDFIEVAGNGNQPVVAMGHVSVEEIVGERPQHGARLRIFISHNRPSVPYSLVTDSLHLVDYVARTNSALREQLARSRWRAQDARLFFRISACDFAHIEPLHVETWRDLELIWSANLNRVLCLAVEGNRWDILKLLDSIHEQEGSDFNDPTPSLPAAPDPHQAAIKFRNELLAKGWPDGKRVAEMAGGSLGKNPAQYAARLRASGALLGVWDAPLRTFRHPDFQFDAHGKVLPEVAQLLKALPGGDDDRGGWRRAFWLYSPHPRLDAESPAQVFKFDAQRVIDVAKREFDGDRNAHW